MFSPGPFAERSQDTEGRVPQGPFEKVRDVESLEQHVAHSVSFVRSSFSCFLMNKDIYIYIEYMHIYIETHTAIV